MFPSHDTSLGFEQQASTQSCHTFFPDVGSPVLKLDPLHWRRALTIPKYAARMKAHNAGIEQHSRLLMRQLEYNFASGMLKMRWMLFVC